MHVLARPSMMSRASRPLLLTVPPEIFLFVTKARMSFSEVFVLRGISGGTFCNKGGDSRDIMLGLAKTCMKLKVSFYDFLGSRLGLPGPQFPPLAKLIRPAPS